jgi:hypothetical protein
MAPGCAEWGSFGFQAGKVWFCGWHKGNASAAVQVAAGVLPPRGQGRLL